MHTLIAVTTHDGLIYAGAELRVAPAGLLVLGSYPLAQAPCVEFAAVKDVFPLVMGTPDTFATVAEYAEARDLRMPA